MLVMDQGALNRMTQADGRDQKADIYAFGSDRGRSYVIHSHRLCCSFPVVPSAKGSV